MKQFLVFMLVFIFIQLNLFAQLEKALPGTDVQGLRALSEKLRVEREANLEKAQAVAKLQNIPFRTEDEDGTITELQGITENGELLFYKTENLDAARTVSTDKVWPLGGLGYNLTGDSMVVGEWDGGAVRSTHQELVGRITQKDAPSGTSDHSTHVAGTMIASGVVAAAKGMAYKAKLDAYDWNSDVSEMATAAGNGLMLSNHSYGFITGWNYNSGAQVYQWYGDENISTTEDYKFGFYDANAQTYDQIAKAAPYYLICKSAGNDRGESWSGSHYYWSGTAWTLSNASRDADGGTTGYDCISSVGNAKNILTVAAVNAIPAGYSIPSDVVMSTFSGWGPSDDGRIKPDISANGVGVYSSLATNNSAYASWNGTSMSSPNAAGSILLIQEHFKKTKGTYIRAATLKGLIIQTANEAGSNPGPDYKFGWGLLNTAGAVQHISNDSLKEEIIETSISDGQTYEINATSDGKSPFWVTISWTDVAGTPVAASLDPTNLMLVNDLDVRVIYNPTPTTYSPYILNPASPANAATTGDNFRDNVEQVYIANPSAGSYTIRITHKGNISGVTQDFSIISSGATLDITPIQCTNLIRTFPHIQNFESFSLCNSVPASSCLLPISQGWENLVGDSIDWSVFSGSTPTSLTGPSADYNPGTGSGKYLYLEATGAGYPLKKAVAQSPCFDLTTLTNPELSFAYNMYGSDMGSLSCEINNGQRWIPIWFSSGDQGSGWKKVQIDLSVYNNDTIQIRIIGITGTGELSDIGMDDIKIGSVPNQCLKTVDNFPYNEDFETFTNCSTTPGTDCSLPASSGWINEISDDIDWIVDNGGTPSSNTGPSVDYNPGAGSGKYLYTEASSNGIGFPNKEAILTGPCFDLSTLLNTKLTFAYHMYGATVGTLYVEVKDGAAWSQVWTLNSNQGNQWDTAQVDLSAYDGKGIQIRFRTVTGSNWSSDIAIDDIKVWEKSLPDFISAQSGNWNNGTSWIGGIAPDKQFHSVLIKNGHNISLIKNELANNVTVENNGTLSLSGNELKTAGNFTVDGSTDQTGSIFFAGTEIQSISGNKIAFNSMELNNANGATITSGNHSIKSALKISNGILITNDALTLLSDSMGTANVGEITGGGISGDVTVQRYLNESTSALFYMIGSPVTGSTLADWNNEIFMGGFPGANSTWGPTVYRYDIDSISVNGDYSEGYVPPTNITNSLVPGEGWMVWVGSSPKTVDVTGPLQTGNVNISVPYNTNPILPAQRGWALLANPYASPVVWPPASRSNITNDEAYVSKPDGNYWAVSNDTIDTIYSAEAFWTKSNGSIGSLLFQESDKATGIDAYNLRMSPKPTYTQPLILELTYTSDTSYLDYSVLRFGGDNNSIYYDKIPGEAYKVANSNGTPPNIASFSIPDRANIYYNTLNPKDSNWTIPLNIWKTYPQSKNETYTIEFNGIESWVNNNHCLILHDSLNNYSNKLDRFNHDYSWIVYDTIKRKYLYLTHSRPIEVSSTNACYGSSDGSATINGFGLGKHTYVWSDQNGNIIKREDSITGSSSMNNLAAGTYTIMVSGNGDCGTMGATVVISEPDPVIADFNPDVDTVWMNSNTTIYFTNSSINADEFHWDFGDGNTSDEQNPFHTYIDGGPFAVRLIANTKLCADTIEKVITVINNVSVEEILRDEKVKIYQQSGKTYVEVNFYHETDLIITMNDILGREVMAPLKLESVLQKRIELKIPANTVGIHIIKVGYDNENAVEKLYYEK